MLSQLQLEVLTPPELDGRSWSEMSALIRAAHQEWAGWAITATMANLVEWPDGTVGAGLGCDHHLSNLGSMWAHSISDRFPGVESPAVPIPAGERSGPKLAAVNRAAAALSGAEVCWYSGADHDVHAQLPQAVAADPLALAVRTSLPELRA